MAKKASMLFYNEIPWQATMRKTGLSLLSPNPFSLSFNWCILLGSIGLSQTPPHPSQVWELGFLLTQDSKICFFLLYLLQGVCILGVWLRIGSCKFLKESKQPGKSSNYTEQERVENASPAWVMNDSLLKRWRLQELLSHSSQGKYVRVKPTAPEKLTPVCMGSQTSTITLIEILQKSFQIFLPFLRGWDEGWLALS